MSSRELVPVITVPVQRQGRWWVAEVAAEGVWTRGRSLEQVRSGAREALALARGIDPALLAVRVVVDAPELDALTEARWREREALAAAVVRLRSQRVSWPETAAALQVSLREARDVWETAAPR